MRYVYLAVMALFMGTSAMAADDEGGLKERSRTLGVGELPVQPESVESFINKNESVWRALCKLNGIPLAKTVSPASQLDCLSGTMRGQARGLMAWAAGIMGMTTFESSYHRGETVAGKGH